jgi:hypothetical protein
LLSGHQLITFKKTFDRRFSRRVGPQQLSSRTERRIVNTAEHIVEAYFRFCRNCFTITDRKVLGGNNRQLDILAYNVKDRTCFHVEVGVTHRTNWCPTQAQLASYFERKFFGLPRERIGHTAGKTDYEKGKNYFLQIERIYQDVGFDPKAVRRVWVCWIAKGMTGVQIINHHSPSLNRSFQVELLSLRDQVLPDLKDAIGTSNYDDEVLRTLGFVKQQDLQKAQPYQAADKPHLLENPSMFDGKLVATTR